MKFIICSTLVSIAVFLLGGWISDWSVTESAFWPWALVSTAGSVGGCFSLIKVR
jgi:hypothetical protein